MTAATVYLLCALFAGLAACQERRDPARCFSFFLIAFVLMASGLSALVNFYH